ncbi:MAG: hypothetical protein ACJAVK_001142 [Akkermansiaceae bacterium]|jgi:hypothetical protein
MKLSSLIVSLISVAGISLLAAESESKMPSLTKDLLEGEIWTKSLAEIKAAYDPEEGEEEEEMEIPEEIRKQLEEQGVNIGEGGGGGARFSWLSLKKEGLRAPGETFTLLAKEIGEVVLREDEKGVKAITVSLYNRGDDGELNVRDYHSRLEEWKTLLDEKLEVRPQSRDDRGVVATTGWMWRKDDIAYLVEGSVSKSPKRAEFIRLRIAPLKGFGATTKKASRTEVKRNVVTKDNGDVFIEGIPMVDQGDKGYCVVASIERVARYFGLKVDQHELAQLADTTAEEGTDAEDMEKAFKKITGKIHIRTNRVMDYDYDQTVKDVKAYDREAKKREVKVFDINFDTHYVIAQGFWEKADKETFKVVKAKQTGYKLFNSKIEQYVDRGIPLCWTLYMGMFPKKGTPQSWGGHMRIIHGYNEETSEIMYTDSWGEGHAMKRMPAIEAWCMTTGVYAMIPLN